MIQNLSMTVIIAGLCSGVVIGVSLDTETERKIRSIDIKRKLFPITTLKWKILKIIFWFLIVITLTTIIAIVVLRLGKSYPLSQIDRYTFGITWFIGISLAKWFRYCYWKKLLTHMSRSRINRHK